jgi:hypothetical protein
MWIFTVGGDGSVTVSGQVGLVCYKGTCFVRYPEHDGYVKKFSVIRLLNTSCLRAS